MSRKEPKMLRVAGLRPFLPQTVPRTVCRFADRRELKDDRRKIISFKRGAYWWSQSEGAYPFSAALESITDQGGWIETIPNPNYRPKGLFGWGTFCFGPSAKRKRKSRLWEGCFNFSKESLMTITAQPQTDRPDPSVIAAQNDAFRKLACLGVPPAQPIPGRMHVTRSLMEVGDGFMAEAVKATGMFETFEPENDPEGWHDFGAVEIRGETVFWKIDLYEADSDFRYGAEAPDNPATTMRVLTIMLARDW